MAYDVTVGFSNGIVRTFKGITQIEAYIDNRWKIIPCPLDFDPLDSDLAFGNYILTNATTFVVLHTYKSNTYDKSSGSIGIVFMEIKITEN